LKKIPAANDELTRLLASLPDSTPGIIELWLLKSRLALGLLKFEEAIDIWVRLLRKILVMKKPRSLGIFAEGR